MLSAHGMHLDLDRVWAKSIFLCIMAFTTRNHYVPQWYQRRFIDPDARDRELFYLDLSPKDIKAGNGKVYPRKAVRRLGPKHCFAQDDLYTLILGDDLSDVIERRFFGEIDRMGAESVDFFSKYSLFGRAHEAVSNLVPFLNAQKLRTPKGIDYLKFLGGTSHQMALHLMGRLFQMHITIWTEGVWEILDASQSKTKLIISDHPVVTYNRGLFPRNPHCLYPKDPPIELLGTQTLFALGPEHCLVITNLGYVRDPETNPMESRENPRYFAPTMFDLRKVQTGRKLHEDEVLAINYIIKRRARRYIAAGHEDWLFPERHLRVTMWDKLGGAFFLRPDPRKVPFSTAMFVGFKDGRSWGVDEYGRTPKDNDPGQNAVRDRERASLQKSKQLWDRRFGKLSPGELFPFL